ncbi:hypothetical protein PQX77_000977 [Marasmius sp. AFHP31]|nr:hypothetical protein PQX77_000977 [Marasmius sp. AFHP31]
MKAVDKHDDATVKGWKEDIDTLLVFAGLFSAVVTAFAVESYEWLLEDPQDVSASVLYHISQQLSNPNMLPVAPTDSPFHPTTSVIRINSLWFLSLIMSLTSGLFGLMCKQWLREHRRDTPNITQMEALGLRQLRHESFKKWGIHLFLGALPVLLEFAVLLFFAGLLEFLWTLHIVAFAIAACAVVPTATIYIFTSVFPALVMLSFTDNEPYKRIIGTITSIQHICPYKSPQAWLVYTMTTKLPKLLSKSAFKRTHIIPFSDWAASDLHVIDNFGTRYPGVSLPPLKVEWRTLKVYELQGLRWLLTIFSDIPSMSLCLLDCLKTTQLHPSTVIAAVFDSWVESTWKEITIEEKFEDFRSFQDGTSSGPLNLHNTQSPLKLGINVQLLFYREFWITWVNIIVNSGPNTYHAFYYLAHTLENYLQEYLSRCREGIRPATRFFLPFWLAEKMWNHSNPDVRNQSINLIRFYEEVWDSKSFPRINPAQGSSDERYNLVQTLAHHILHCDNSVLLTTPRGYQFLEFVNGKILEDELFPSDAEGLDFSTLDEKVTTIKGLAAEWRTAMNKAIAMKMATSKPYVIPPRRSKLTRDSGGGDGWSEQEPFVSPKHEGTFDGTVIVTTPDEQSLEDSPRQERLTIITHRPEEV